MTWNTTVRPWIEAAKMLTPHRPLTFAGAQRSRKLALPIVAVGVAAAAVAGTGTAYAYFHAAGSGSGSSHIANVLSVSVPTPTAAEAPSTTLVPGGSANVSVKVTNPNGYAVTVYQVARTPSTSITASNGCATTGVSFVTQTALSVTVPAGATQVIPLSNAAAMDASSSSSCQGATFNIPVTVTVRK